jgi:drug/metabolite transporter (DMT)-like permease
VKNRGAPLVLGLALAGVSLSGPLVRLSHAHPLAIAAWRTGLALLVVCVVLLTTGSWRHWSRLSRRELGIGVGAGVLLALHFWSWNASIALTTVAASVVLVNTQPIIVALFSALWLREPPSRRQWLGIMLAMVGALVVALPDLLQSAYSGAHPRALTGDLLALIGAFTAAFYFLAGRRLRATLDLWPYVGLVYGSCFVALLVFAFAAGATLAPQPPRELGIFAALAIGPMLIGHTGLNWALKHSPAFVVNLTLLGEPVGATFLAAMLPGIREVPGIATLAGGAVVLAGILIVTRE